MTTILFGIRKEVLENPEKCSELKEYLSQGHNIPLTVITDCKDGIVHCTSCFPSKGKTFDVTKLPEIESSKWIEATSQMISSENPKDVTWFSSAEEAIRFLETL